MVDVVCIGSCMHEPLIAWEPMIAGFGSNPEYIICKTEKVKMTSIMLWFISGLKSTSTVLIIFDDQFFDIMENLELATHRLRKIYYHAIKTFDSFKTVCFKIIVLT